MCNWLGCVLDVQSGGINELSHTFSQEGRNIAPWLQMPSWLFVLPAVRLNGNQTVCALELKRSWRLYQIPPYLSRKSYSVVRSSLCRLRSIAKLFSWLQWRQAVPFLLKLCRMSCSISRQRHLSKQTMGTSIKRAGSQKQNKCRLTFKILWF